MAGSETPCQGKEMDTYPVWIKLQRRGGRSPVAGQCHVLECPRVGLLFASARLPTNPSVLSPQ